MLATAIEIMLCKNIIKRVHLSCVNMNIIWIGSCTGEVVHSESKEGYHYVKGMQRYMNRFYGCSGGSIKSNLIELSAYEKYDKSQQTSEYKERLIKSKKLLKGKDVPSIKELITLVQFLSRLDIGMSGEELRLDNGLMKIQLI